MLKNLTIAALGALHLESDGDEDTYDAIGKEICERCSYANVENVLCGSFHHFRETPNASRFAALHAMMIAYQYSRDVAKRKEREPEEGPVEEHQSITLDEEFKTKAAQRTMREMIDDKKCENASTNNA